MAVADLTAAGILTEVAVALRPLGEAADHPQPDGLMWIASRAGVDLQAMLDDEEPLVEVAAAIGDAYDPLREFADSGEEAGAGDVPALLAAADGVFRATAALDALDVGDMEEFFAAVGRRIVDHLVISYLYEYRPLGYSTLRLLGVIDPGDEDVEREDDGPRRPPSLRLEALSRLLEDPSGPLREAYGWGTAVFAPYPLLHNLARVLAGLGVPAYFASPDAAEANALGTPPERERPDRHLEILLLMLAVGDTPVPLGLRVLPLSPPDDNAGGAGAGLGIVPFGTADLAGRHTLSAGWEARVRTSADAAIPYGVVVRPGSAQPKSLAGDEVPQVLHAEAALEPVNRFDEPTIVVGERGGPRLEFGTMGLRVTATVADELELVVAFPMLECRVVVEPSAEDNFLQELLGTGHLAATFDLVPAWSAASGLHLQGSGDLATTLPAHHDSGPVRIEAARLAVAPGDDGSGFTLEASVAARARLGPVSAVVEGLGFELSVEVDKDGDAPPLRPRLKPSPPTGVGLTLDAGPVSGGGYLFADPVGGRYAGAIELDIDRLALNAVGLLDTRLPEGGYSLLVAVSAEDFPPVRLGFGFTLLGVGGIVGVNRAANVDALRAGLADHSLDAVLFPNDPLADTARLVRDLAEAFPLTPGRHVAGPAVKLGWGAPTMITGELALAIEFPEPVRVIAVGRVRARLPSEDRVLVRLNMNALGLIDVDEGRAALDATLYDSDVAGHRVSGEMALRSSWGRDPHLVLAVGGLHPRFPAPSGFPTLDRVAVALTSGDDPRLRMEAYLALTANTVQIGARLDLLVRRKSFTIEGYLGFDALFSFEPFGFQVEAIAGVRLAWKGRSIGAVDLALTLAGPAPVRARGQATFTWAKLSHTADFDITVGREQSIPAPPAPEPLRELVAALQEPNSWEGTPPNRPLAVLAGHGQGLLHPAGDFAVRQHVVPLDTAIARFGNRPLPGGPHRFALDAEFDGAPVSELGTVRDHFAPAQFFELGDAEKLSRPSFERLPAGIRFAGKGLSFPDEDELGTTVTVEYRTRVMATNDGAIRDGTTYALPPGGLESASRRADARPDGHEAAPAVTVDEPAFLVTRMSDMGVDPAATPATQRYTFTEAQEAMRREIARRPNKVGRLQVVTRQEALGPRFDPQAPGEIPRRPGEYLEVDLDGTVVEPRQVTMEPGDQPLPPTQAPDRAWQWVGPPESGEAGI